MKKLLALLIVTVLCMFAFASCSIGKDNNKDNPPHVHTYEDKWTSDDKEHWHKATCDCQDVTENKIAHTDKNNDGACDVCEKQYQCKDGHSYAEEWTFDSANHWHAADCGHVVAGSELAAHADGNNDGKCDTCAYVIREVHVHYFSEEWSSDEAYHWHAALCEHKEEVADKAAHVLDAAGNCTVCGAKVGEIDKTNLGIVLGVAVSQNGKVVDGSVTASQIVYSGSGENMYVSALLVNDVYFVLGNDASYVYWKTLDENGAIVGAVENWYELVGEDQVFGVEKQSGSFVFVPVSGTVAHLNGYTYNPGSILPGMDVDTTTLANTLSAIYGLKVAGTRVSDATENYNAETGEYSFSFKYFTVNAATQSDDSVHYQVEVYYVDAKFTVNDDFVINSCELNVSVFRNVEQDMDLDYDPDTDTYTLRAEANPSVYSYEVAQHSGERTFTNPYPRKTLTPDSFDYYIADVEILEDAEGVAYNEVTLVEKIAETINVKANTQLYIALSNIKPSTGSHAFITIGDFEISFVNNTAGDEGVLFVASEFNPSYSYQWNYGYIAMFVKDAGTYTLTIKYGENVKNIEVVVEEDTEPGLVAGENEILVETTETYGYADEYTFVAADGEGKYTFNIPAGLGFWSKSSQDSNPYSDPEVGFYSNENGATVVVELAANEEYVFYVGAINKGQWLISYSYEAGSVGGGDQGGEPEVDYETVIVAGPNTLYFSADEVAADTANRVANITEAGNYKFAAGELFVAAVTAKDGTVIARNNDYTYTLAAGEYTITFGMLSMFGVVADRAYELNVENTTAVEPEPEPEEAVLVLGDNTVTISEEEAASGGKMFSFTAIVNGTYTFASNDVGVRLFYDNNMVGMGIVDLEAGKTYNAFVLAMEAGTYNINITAVESSGSEEEEGASGTESDPIILDATGDYTCAFPGGYAPVFYAYTPAEGGYVTVSTTFAAGWLQVGTNLYDLKSNSGSGADVVAYVSANTLCYITVADWDEAEVAVPFTVSFEAGELSADGTADAPFALEENNTCAFPGGWNPVFYTYTAEVAGTLTITVTSTDYYWGYGSGQFTQNNVGSSTPSGEIALTAGETVLISISTDSAAEGNVTFTASFVAAE